MNKQGRELIIKQESRKVLLDECHLMHSNPTQENKEHGKQINRLINWHLVNDENEIKHSAIWTQVLDRK